MPDRQDLLVADIGGTNCRLAHFVSHHDGQFSGKSAVLIDRLKLENVVWLASQDLASNSDLLSAFSDFLRVRPEKAGILAVAIAGPVLDGKQARLTNGRLELKLESLRRACPNSHLLNDFTAQVYSCLLPDERLARTRIRAGKPPDGPESCSIGKRAAIGAGTGLGVASLVPVGTGCETIWLSIPSEAGHTAFSFCGNEENAFHEFLCQQRQIPFATCEDVLSGKGLALLHQFLTGMDLLPAEVGKQALQVESETLAMYARFYGRFARNWILTSLCSGGIHVCGGIAAKNPLVVTSKHFLDEMLRQSASCPAHLARLIGETPVCLATDENQGLWGAAVAGLCLGQGKIG